MKNLYKYLLYANGLLAFLVSLVILSHIWFDTLQMKDVFGKSVGSYCLLIVNFVIFSTLYSKYSAEDQKQKTKTND